MKEGGWTVADAANAAGSLERQSCRCPAFYRSGGALTLADRSSAPQRCKLRISRERVGDIERFGAAADQVPGNAAGLAKLATL